MKNGINNVFKVKQVTSKVTRDLKKKTKVRVKYFELKVQQPMRHKNLCFTVYQVKCGRSIYVR